MRTIAITNLAVALVVTLAASSAWAGTVDGTVKMGGVIFNETGDLSAVQETYNVHDGFALTQIQLSGRLNPRSYFMMDLRDVNLDSRQGDFLYRVPGWLKLTAGYDQDRQVFDPGRAVHSMRKDLKVGAEVTPSKWLGLSGFFNYLTRDGDRLSYPAGTASALGDTYDNTLVTGQWTAEVRKGRRGGAISYSHSGYSDNRNRAADRTGRVVSARLYTPSPFYDKWTHLMRAAFGVRKLSNSDIDYTLANFQYTGIVQPVETFLLKYNFDANRIDNESTGLRTDRFQNDLDATLFYKYGRLTGGYGYETNDDDRTLTSYQSWRAGASFRIKKVVGAQVDYAGRVKKDTEELTLLKDVEASRFRASLNLEPVNHVVLNGGYSRRERELTDIGVKVDGDVVNASGRFDQERWGSLSGDYTYSIDKYRDLAGRFDANSHIVTARAEFVRIRNLRLAGGVTYLDIRKDLDIEKSMLLAEGSYRVLRDYHLEVKYNVYNYDDYILLDRYYTANVLRINLAYDLHL